MKKRISKRFAGGVAVGLIAAMAIPWAAFADNLRNDVVAGGNDTITVGDSTTINYRIQATGGDGGPSGPGSGNCNPDDGTPAIVTLSVPAGVTASRTTFTFTNCDSLQSVSFSASIPGNYPISVANINDSGYGTYDNRANFTLKVNAAPSSSDTTPPHISYVLNPATPDGNNGWYKSNVSLTWTVVENESPSSLVKSGCVDQIITTDQPATIYSCLASSTGGSAGPANVSIKRDVTPPSISGSDITNTTWRNTTLSENFTASDTGSGLANTGDASFTLTASAESANASTPTAASKTVSDNAGNSATRTLSALIDLTPPVLTDQLPTADPDGTNGWYKSAVTNQFRATDNLSGFTGPSTTYDFTQSSGSAEGALVKVNSGSVSDAAGNEATAIDSAPFKIDLSDPTDITFNGGPAADSSHYFGSVPAAPTCTAKDAVSGMANCIVTGHSTTIGNHTMTATATDNAGRQTTAQISYTVLPWNLSGFYQPIEMGSNVVNTVKGGATVPLKFEVFAGTTELTATSIVQTMAKQVTCNIGTEDPVSELAATGGTSLRYDSVAGQFVYNWQTPKLPGKCYDVTITTQDGSSLTTKFKLK